MNSTTMMTALTNLGRYSWINFGVDDLFYQMVKGDNDTFFLKRLVGDNEISQDAVTFKTNTCPLDPNKELIEIERRQSDLGKGRKKVRKQDQEGVDSGIG